TRHTISERVWRSEVCSSDLFLKSNNFDPLSFFFQAEDGIRDRNVTGVQTCALPISPQCKHAVFWLMQWYQADFFASAGRLLWPEIGRASCRERVGLWGVVV